MARYRRKLPTLQLIGSRATSQCGRMPFPGVFVPHVPSLQTKDSAPVAKRRSAFGAARKAGAHHTPSELINQEVSRPGRTTTRYPPHPAKDGGWQRMSTTCFISFIVEAKNGTRAFRRIRQMVMVVRLHASTSGMTWIEGGFCCLPSKSRTEEGRRQGKRGPYLDTET